MAAHGVPPPATDPIITKRATPYRCSNKVDAPPEIPHDPPHPAVADQLKQDARVVAIPLVVPGTVDVLASLPVRVKVHYEHGAPNLRPPGPIS